MKIGITCYPTYGGSGVVGAELGLELAKRGHDIHFISYAEPMRLSDGSAQSEHIKFHPVDMLSYPLFEYPPYTDALASKLFAIAEAEQLDVLHMHYAIPHAVSAYLAREKEPELADVRIVRASADFDPMMPEFVPAFLTHLWSREQRRRVQG